jgi:hypothetical protein
MNYVEVMRKFVISNKYSKVYFNIIINAHSRAKTRKTAKKILGYVEGHHIVPKSICPELSKCGENIVYLTAREHFICHMLLTKCVLVEYRHSMYFAFFKMFNVNTHQIGNRYVNSKFYEYASKLNSDACKVRNSKRVYSRGYTRPHSYETKLKIGESNKGTVSYYNEETHHNIFLKDGDEIPVGYIKRASKKLIDASSKRIKGSVYIHNIETGVELRFKGSSIPDGYIKGRSVITITDGKSNKTINKITDIIPDGWNEGRYLKPTKAIRRANNPKPINTPLGIYPHPLEFCEKYNVDRSFFDKLDSKIRNRKSNEILINALLEVGCNLSETKSEMGFRFL